MKLLLLLFFAFELTSCASIKAVNTNALDSAVVDSVSKVDSRSEVAIDPKWYLDPYKSSVYINGNAVQIVNKTTNETQSIISFEFSFDRAKKSVKIIFSEIPGVDYSFLNRYWVGYALVTEKMDKESTKVSIFSKGKGAAKGFEGFNMIIEDILPENSDYRLIITGIRLLHKSGYQLEYTNFDEITLRFNGTWFITKYPSLVYNLIAKEE